MKKIILAAMAMFATVGVASAQDIRADRSGFYIGGTVGSTVQDNAQTALGALAGYQFHPNFRLEGTYDYLPQTTGGNSNLVMLNSVAQYRIPSSVITPYLLGGVGVGLDGFGTTNGDPEAVYALGVGVRAAVSTNVELDARYRYISQFSGGSNAENASILTVGANFRF